ncbi:LOW QUALITY PROTEIN: 5-hydroxytryptamine receptor 1F-like [Lethenteron reissneri]|uniref:LOW QUALITY PROTEIN: 5-hydroxytryptamine receptor 1F-like n=1 Tax=Lethenteron reissneri TaxID=7753 RepID=UPI002AB7F03A|nr:LOW QUALITY PROTEIN: 5-hydroxytryptamine receptor 1F-like [Lethenteron reissneri]
MNSSSSSLPWSDAPPASTTSAAHTATVSLLLASVALATALANGLVIAAVAATPKLRHPANYLICSLAVADLLVALLVMPPGAAAAATGSWPLGPAACAVWTSADVTCCTASILSLCAIALDRYCAIARAVRYAPRRTPRRAAAMIAAVWVASILVSMPLALATVGGGGQPGGARTDAAAVVSAAEGAWNDAARTHGRVEGPAPTAPPDDAQESGGTLGSDGGGDAPHGVSGGIGVGVAAQTERGSAVPADPVSTQSDTPPTHHTTTTAATTRAPQPGAERDAAARRRCAARHAHVLYAVVCTVGAFYAPMALLLVLYCGIYRAARSHFRRGLRGSRVLCGATPNGGVVATGVSLAGVDAGVPLQEEVQGQDGHGHGRGQGRHQRLQGDEDDNEDDEEDRSSSSSSLSIEASPLPFAVRVALGPTSGARRRWHREPEAPSHLRSRESVARPRRLGLILGAFTLCWLPFFVRELVVNVCEACAPPEALSELISWLGYANSLVNPLIYTTLNEDFRAAFKRMRGPWRYFMTHDPRSAFNGAAFNGSVECVVCRALNELFGVEASGRGAEAGVDMGRCETEFLSTVDP